MIDDARLFDRSLIVLAVILMLGGAGLYYPLIQCLIELLSLVLLWIALRELRRRGMPPNARWLLAGAVSIPLVLLLQLVPLPPFAWAHLPGRDIVRTVISDAGLMDRWYPLSLTPDQTLRALLGLLPPIATFLWISVLGIHERLRALAVVIGVALVGAVLGSLQIAYSGSPAFHIFDTSHVRVATGLFTNRNHHALMLLLAMVCMAAWAYCRRRETGTAAAFSRIDALFVGIMGLLVLGVLSTASRTGFALLAIALAAAGIVYLQDRLSKARLIISGACIAILGAILLHTPLAERTLNRFATVNDDLRFNFWTTTSKAASATWPWGTGFGSFPSFYPTVEPLNQLTNLFPNHAHSDWLELALEGGLPAILLTAAILVVAFWRAVTAYRRGGHSRALASAAFFGILLIGLHSIDDYPVRMTTIAVVLAILLGLLTPRLRARTTEADAKTTDTSRVTSGITIAFGLGLALASISNGLARHDLLMGNGKLAVTVAPWSGEAWSAYAAQQLRENRPKDADQAARRALEISPIDVAAVRSLGFAQIAMSNDSAGRASLRIAGQLSWRDVPTQAWLIDRAVAEGDRRIAVLRVDALLRQNIAVELLYERLAAALSDPTFAHLLAMQLEARPWWRNSFFYGLGRYTSGNLANVRQFLVLLGATGAPASTAEMSALLAPLISGHQEAAARDLWLASGQHAWLADSSFDEASGAIGMTSAPYRWSAPASFMLTVRQEAVEKPLEGQAAVIRSDGMASGTALSQMLLLPAGRYRLQLAARSKGAPLGNGSLQLICQLGDRAVQVARQPLSENLLRDGWHLNQLDIEIPPACAAQHFAVAVSPYPGEFSVQIDKVSIQPLPSGLQ